MDQMDYVLRTSSLSFTSCKHCLEVTTLVFLSMLFAILVIGLPRSHLIIKFVY